MHSVDDARSISVNENKTISSLHPIHTLHLGRIRLLRARPPLVSQLTSVQRLCDAILGGKNCCRIRLAACTNNTAHTTRRNTIYTL